MLSSETDNPLQVITGAIDALQDFSQQLQDISETIDTKFEIPDSGQAVTLSDIVLHSRDASPEEFGKAVATAARQQALQVAEPIETQLKNLNQVYLKEILPNMELATKICQETPCGGATWEVDFASSVDSKVRVEGNDTPCGRLHTANLQFLEATFRTKPQITLGSRAALILRLAEELQQPLSTIRASGSEEQNNSIRTTFQTQNVPTPWIRSEAEYEEFFRIQKELQN